MNQLDALKQFITTVIPDLQAAPESVADVYLRLHLLSHRLMLPRTINLDGVFGQLANVAWTNLGPAPVEGLEELRWRVRHDGGVLTVHRQYWRFIFKSLMHYYIAGNHKGFFIG